MAGSLEKEESVQGRDNRTILFWAAVRPTVKLIAQAPQRAKEAKLPRYSSGKSYGQKIMALRIAVVMFRCQKGLLARVRGS